MTKIPDFIIKEKLVLQKQLAALRKKNPSIFPTTTPTQFDPDALHASIDRMLEYQPDAMYLTHYSRVGDVDRLAADLHRLIGTQVAVARAARGDGVARHVEILAGLEQIVREEAERQGWTMPEDDVFELLKMDLELNAQGLGVWLDACSADEVASA